MVGGHWSRKVLGTYARGHEESSGVRIAVNDREVVRHVHRNPGQQSADIGNGLRHFQEIAHHQRNPKPLSRPLPSAICERNGKAGVVHAVHQPPETVAHPEHPPSRPSARQHNALTEVRVVVVVTYQCRRLADKNRLRASRQKGRRVPLRQHSRSYGVIVG